MYNYNNNNIKSLVSVALHESLSQLQKLQTPLSELHVSHSSCAEDDQATAPMHLKHCESSLIEGKAPPLGVAGRLNSEGTEGKAWRTGNPLAWCAPFEPKGMRFNRLEDFERK